MSDKELKIVISAIDKATAPIKAMGSSISKFSNDLNKSFADSIQQSKAF